MITKAQIEELSREELLAVIYELMERNREMEAEITSLRTANDLAEFITTTVSGFQGG